MITDPTSGPIPFGRYVLEHRLATGGMAEIFLARQEGPGGFSRELVIKRILPHYVGETGFVEMFLDEAKLAANLAHPNIVPIFDFGEVDGSWYLAMELVRGPDLRNILEAGLEMGRLLPFHILAKIVADAAQGLEHAHRLKGPDGHPLNIIHRDVSPSNVIISYDGVTKMLDFGIAKGEQSKHKTQAGFIKGKFSYMPPEQVEGKKLDPRTDVYALGVVLYELATGRLPFQGESDFALMRSILEVMPTSPREISAGVPEGLEKIILRALAKRPDDRFKSARELAAALERFAIDQFGPVSSFDVSEAIAEFRAAYGKPLDVLSKAGLTDGTGQRIHSAQPNAEVALSSQDRAAMEDQATLLRPGLREAKPEGPSQSGVETQFFGAVNPVRAKLEEEARKKAEAEAQSAAAEGAAPSEVPGNEAKTEFMAAVTPESLETGPAAAPPAAPPPASSPPEPEPAVDSEADTLFMPAVTLESIGAAGPAPSPPAESGEEQASTTEPPPEQAIEPEAEAASAPPAPPDERIEDSSPREAEWAYSEGDGSVAASAPHPEYTDEPFDGAPSGSNKKLFIGLGGAAVVILIAIAAALSFGSRDPDTSPVPLAHSAPEATAETKDPAPEDEGTAAPDSEPTELAQDEGEPSDAEGDSAEGSALEDDEAVAADSEDTTEPASADPSPVPDVRQVAVAAPPESEPAPSQQPAPTRPQPTQERRPAAQPGFVMVQSQPWSEIVYAGEVLGTTPRRIELPPGRRELLLRNPEANLEKRVTVQVRSTQTSRVSVSLGEGRVAVLVRPFGEVWVGGERRGVTPMPPLVLPAGRHTIDVVHPESGKRSSHTVNVVHGETATLRVDLSDE